MDAIDTLVEEFARLPGIGRKTAGRLTFFLLKRPRDEALRLAHAIQDVTERVVFCSRCANVSEDELCAICRDPRRDPRLICVVEEASDIRIIERSGGFRGLYHVLHGRLSPLEGRGPDTLTLELLERRVGEGGVDEVILATNPDVEGEATALFLQRRLQPLGVRVSRIARGIPMGGDIEFVDEVTIGEALAGRREL
ncbi:MAG: recombination protein RecR [Gemmatimonadetes bacterium]|nr:recombination protein RecR [Gemmatimonadota bacterium]